MRGSKPYVRNAEVAIGDEEMGMMGGVVEQFLVKPLIDAKYPSRQLGERARTIGSLSSFSFQGPQ